MLDIKGLTKKIKNNLILDELDLEVQTGELIHVIGTNGSGKSTLFKLICHIMEADAGEIALSEQVTIGALIENPYFMENSSAQSNLKFLADINRQYDEKLIRQLLTQFDLDFDSPTRLKKYSLGMRQKVGIIQAIMENQNLILLDEPTRGLDQKALTTFNRLIAELITEQKTIIIASHDNLSELNFTRKLRLENGKLVAI
ncbi:ATP-binding cassette domain-containing protein [Latilactobacillus fuchuensis]|uniref:Phosphonate C-P lyase system protein PhnK n=1 Tax=Latilactobacillus fuchuensis DSM 14340 = JCM 11249 TaxID=1423747 RepID=A0A0R1S2A4_9LACO|nr:ABC transporter ATP-binding protein [Latilactobacillus fuchuensis]KRL59563.1 phosphonate C-P lyase system protein PhnK [Latilactobacillus fuchuensis DSM 14340 = JCM 11249]MCP8858087.1 ABC transporter ATP-binding protein [Latilactobacillus fuchuensis]